MNLRSLHNVSDYYELSGLKHKFTVHQKKKLLTNCESDLRNVNLH